jgi:hypothetical protein
MSKIHPFDKLSVHVHKTIVSLTQNYHAYLKILGLMLLSSVLLKILSIVVGMIAVKFALAASLTFAQVISLKLALAVIAWIILFVFAVYFHGLLVQASLGQTDLKKNKLSLKKNFANFLILSIYFVIAGFLVYGPIFGIGLIGFLQLPAKNLIALLLLLLFIAALLFLSILLSLTPYVLLDSGKNAMTSLKNSLELIRGHEPLLIGRIVILAILILAFQIIYAVSFQNNLMSFIASLVFLIFVLPFIYSFFALLYKHLKS